MKKIIVLYRALLFTLIGLVSLSQIANGQDSTKYHKADSIFKTAVQLQVEKDYYRSLINYYAALDLSNEIGYTERKISCLKNIGVIYNQTGHYDIALDFYTDGAALLIQVKDSVQLARMYLNIGRVLSKLEKADSARYYLNEALNIFIDKKEYEFQSRIETTIGLNYEVDSLYDSARQWYQKSLLTSKKVNPDYYNFKSAYAYNNIGYTYFIEGNDSCQFYYNKSLEYVQYAPNMAYFLYSNLGELYRDSDSDTTIYYMGKTVEAYNTKEIHPFYIHSLTELARYHLKRNPEKSIAYTDQLSEATVEQLKLYRDLVQLNERYQVQAVKERIEKENKTKQLIIQERNNLATYIGSSILFILIIIFITIRFIKKRKRINKVLDDMD